MTKFTLATLLLISVQANANNCRSLNDFDWLQGKWQTQKDQTLTTETWHKLSENTFEGTGTTPNSAESLRLLAMSGEIFYLAKVAHNPSPIAFKLVQCKDKSYIFENKLHDFPNKIEYRKISKTALQIIVSGKDEKSFSIQLHRRANENGPK